MTTIQDIKKALEICSEDDGCRECPYYDYRYCDKALLKDALALITEQNQEYQEQRIKQAQIDILNELKKYLHAEDFDTPDERWRPESEFCAIIDKMLKEVQNAENKS